MLSVILVEMRNIQLYILFYGSTLLLYTYIFILFIKFFSSSPVLFFYLKTIIYASLYSILLYTSSFHISHLAIHAFHLLHALFPRANILSVGVYVLVVRLQSTWEQMIQYSGPLPSLKSTRLLYSDLQSNHSEGNIPNSICNLT
jgi:hypothetical protein